MPAKDGGATLESRAPTLSPSPPSCSPRCSSHRARSARARRRRPPSISGRTGSAASWPLERCRASRSQVSRGAEPGEVEFRTRSIERRTGARGGGCTRGRGRPGPRLARSSDAAAGGSATRGGRAPRTGIEARAVGDVSRVRAHLVWSPELRVPLRVPASTVHAADRPPLGVGCERVDPACAADLRLRDQVRDRAPHGGQQRLHARRGRRDRARDPALPRPVERLERHRLQLSRRPLRDDLRGSLRGRRPERGRRARARVQHRLRGHRSARHVRQHEAFGRRAGRNRAAHRVAPRSCARRSDFDTHVRVGREREVRGRDPGPAESRLGASRHGLDGVPRKHALRASGRHRRVGPCDRRSQDLRAEGGRRELVDPHSRALVPGAALGRDGHDGSRRGGCAGNGIRNDRGLDVGVGRSSRRLVQVVRSPPGRHVRQQESSARVAARRRSRSRAPQRLPRRSARTATARPTLRR